MVGKPEIFDKFDTKYKMTLIQMEKRFVDLETAISEINARVKDLNFDAVTAVQQRVSDIEDLIMVEQAAVIELKKMMEGWMDKFKSQIGADDIKSLEEKLAKIENDVKYISEMPSGTTEVEEKINKLQQDVSELKVKPTAPEIPTEELEKFEGRLNVISNEMLSLKNNLKDKIDLLDSRVKDLASRSDKPTADYDFFSSRIDSLKAGIDLLTDKKVETDMKVGGLEEKINLMEEKIRETLSQKVFDGIRLNKKDIMSAGVRIDAVERVLKELTEELHELMKTTKKFENFERLTILNKDVEEKLERFKFIEDETRRLSQRIEMIYDDLDKRLETMKSAERNMQKTEQSISEIRKQLEMQKIEVHQKVGRDSLLELEKKTSSALDEFNDGIVEFENRIRVINKSQIDELNKSMDSITKSLNAVNERIGLIEETYKNLMDRDFNESVMQNMKAINKKLENDYTKFNEINKRLENVENRKVELPNIDEVNRRIESLEKMRIQPSKVAELPETFQRALADLKASNAQIYDMSKRLNFIEDRIKGIQNSVDKRIAKMQMSTNIDTQIAELIDKIVFLESRLGAMEDIAQKTQNFMSETKKAIQKSQQNVKVQPVILE